ncbi:ATP-dependent Clp protease proteolytic subunit [Actinoplanes sp. N902-109]|uniref:ATP-dependent Clp protease proteolytic subunit n=1 Tax=Actinoplanes sp. (strain N902-109) TaxID=649831 RepID=UPI0003293DC7|nr:ATP-dependent Clp protease proteolytic subunit [Actinoplanes sp. N902-109]AGL17219.1 endopeptidase Clp [Actinoplanes sp. N902-109]
MQNAQPHGLQLTDELLKQRIIFLGTEVNDESANALCAQLLLLSAADPARDIQFYINSPGGSVTAGMAVYDTMRFIPNDVATIGIGLAGSMGQFLLTAGTAGKRYALPHTRIMMHQAAGGIGGTAADITIQAENMLFVKRQMHELIARHSGRPVAQIAEDSDRDRWFTADQARDYGLIDDVITEAAAVPA